MPRRFSRRIGRSGAHSSIIAAVEALESRQLLSAVVGQSLPTFEVAAAGASLSPPFTPSEFRTAYGLNNLSFGINAASGAGQTIAIIDAYNDPDITTDLNSFIGTYGLEPVNGAGEPTFTVENQFGQVINPATTTLTDAPTPGGWDLEESLDVQWEHVVAPMANLVLFEAGSDSNNDLYQAAQTAADTPGVSVVAMSFGGPEFTGETSEDNDFVTPAGHQGVTFIASTGDSGYPGGYPAASPNIVAVGGTSLTINSDGSYGGETGWSGSGGLISQVEPQPSYQNGASAPYSTTARTIPDVSWLGDPDTGVSVLDSYGTSVDGTAWLQVGGTSLATQLWGGLTGIINQGRALSGKPTLYGASQTLPALYSLSSSDFHDITSGNNGFPAEPGYDVVTGLGSPIATSLVPAMVSENFAYVDSSATGAANGSSWGNAYPSLQTALSGATGPEVIDVGQGTYSPGSSASATFQLVDGVSVFGDFAGTGAANPDASGPSFTTTLTSGAAGQVILSGNATNSTALIDGFTISGGAGMQNINGSPTINGCTFTNDSATDGGAIDDQGSSPSITGCTFTNDSATDGGAIYNDSTSDPSLQYCTFTHDTASMGGAVYDSGGSPSFSHCTFQSDSTTVSGGAIENVLFASPTVLDCFFYVNSSDLGGAIANENSNPQIVNSVFVGNTSLGIGGALSNDASSTPQIINCTFTVNSASQGGAMSDTNSSDPVVVNSILWLDSGGEIFNQNPGTATVSFSDVGTNPDFVTAPNLSAGNFGNLALQDFSPFINAGSNAAVPVNVTTDIAGNPRIVGGIVDDGAYELDQIYVDYSATGMGNGGSWANAFAGLSAALAVTNSGETILIAGGTYAPTTSNTNRTATFAIANNIAIYGGYEGLAGSSPFTRNIASYPTVLTGNIGGAGGSYHVVTINVPLNSNSVLDGLTITGGAADGTGDGNSADGAGMIDFGGSPTINDCTFTSNIASGTNGGAGGAMLLIDASPTITNCSFTNNTATGGAAGAVYCFAGSSPELENCTFTGNTATNAGGAFFDYQSSDPTLINCTFNNNSSESGGAMVNFQFCSPGLQNCTFANNIASDGYGGAIYDSTNSSPALVGCTFTTNAADGTSSSGGVGGAVFDYYFSSPDLMNCVFDGNTALAGGAIYNTSNASPTITQSIFVGNTATGFDGFGGAIGDNTDCSPAILNCTFTQNTATDLGFGGAIFNFSTSSPTVTNCILWNDSASTGNEIYNEDSASKPVVSYSDVSGGASGTANLNANPLFVSTPVPSSQNYGNLELQETSPCINVGNTSAINVAGVTTDLAGNPRIIDTIVDLGAYEAQLVAVTWTGAGDGINWSNAANWSDHLVPSQNDDVTIPAGVTSLQVASGTFAAHSVTSGSSIHINAASLSLYSSSNISGLLTIQNSGVLNLTNAKLLINFGSNADPISTIQSYLQSGYNNGGWNGTGIVSTSVAAANFGLGAPLYSIGYGDGADGTVPGLASGQIELLPTLLGDATLSGSVNFADFQLVLVNFDQPGTWDKGDFNYNSTVDFSDFQQVLANFGKISSLTNGLSDNAVALETLPSTPDATAGGILIGQLSLKTNVFASATSVRPNQPGHAGNDYASSSNLNQQKDGIDFDGDILSARRSVRIDL